MTAATRWSEFTLPALPGLCAAAITSNKTFSVLALSIHSSKFSSSSDRVNWVINIKFPKRFLFTYILFFFSLANFEKHFECYCVCATAYLTASVTVCINGACKVLRTSLVVMLQFVCIPWNAPSSATSTLASLLMISLDGNEVLFYYSFRVCQLGIHSITIELFKSRNLNWKKPKTKRYEMIRDHLNLTPSQLLKLSLNILITWRHFFLLA